MRRSLLILALAALAGGSLAAVVLGLHAGVETALLLAVVGGTSLGAAHAVAARRSRLTLSRQFSAGVAVAVGAILVATAVGALLMFVSEDDAVMICVVTLFAGLVAVRAAQLLATGVRRDVESLQHGLEAVGEGRRDVRLATEAGDELRRIAQAANAMVERLAREEAGREAADRARRDLVAAASHDLRTPIASLRLLVDAIDDDLVDEPTRRRYQATMRTHLQALGALIDDLFELSRLEARDIAWSMQQVELGALVGETVAAMSPQAKAKRVSVSSELQAPLGPARADPERLQRVLFNLIQNAIRHTPADGSVTVRAERSALGVEIEVADTGEGIPAQERADVFTPFYRGRGDEARGGDGTGLGLAISRAIVEAHGGTIWLEDGEPGTRVRFSLPAG